MYEFRQVPSAGMGTFATQDIPFGTLILNEQPLFAVVWSVAEDPIALYGAFLRHPVAAQQAFLQLHASDEMLDEKRAVITPRLHELASDASIDQVVRVAAVFELNCFNIGNGTAAVYANQSRLNHACCPNVLQSAALGDRSQSMRAIRNIAAGEQLFCTYIECSHLLHQRREKSRRYGFECACALCTLEAFTASSEARKTCIEYYGKYLCVFQLRVVVRFWRRWFGMLLNSRTADEFLRRSIDERIIISETVPFAEIGLRMLDVIVATRRTGEERKVAQANLDYWEHLTTDFIRRYGTRADWARETGHP